MEFADILKSFPMSILPQKSASIKYLYSFSFCSFSVNLVAKKKRANFADFGVLRRPRRELPGRPGPGGGDRDELHAGARDHDRRHRSQGPCRRCAGGGESRCAGGGGEDRLRSEVNNSQ